MKTQRLLLASIIFGVCSVHAEPDVQHHASQHTKTHSEHHTAMHHHHDQSHPTPSHPDNTAQDFLATHTHSGTESLSPLPPRRVSPVEFERAQVKIKQLRHAEQPKVSVQSIPTMRSAQQRVIMYDSVSTMTSFQCNSPEDLLPFQGAQLVERILQSPLNGCLYGLYNADFSGSALFSDANLAAVLTAIESRLDGFDGSNASGAAEMEKLVSFLRSAHWVEESAQSQRDFTAQYQDRLVLIFNRYFAGDHFVRFDGRASRNFMLRYEMLILVSSSGADRLRYMPRFAEALIGYSQTVDRTDSWGVNYEENGLTQILTHYFNASIIAGDAWKQTLQQHPQIIHHLRSFILTDANWLVGHTREYQWSDAISELGRLLKYGGAIADQVRPAMQQILAAYSYSGVGSTGWINAQTMVTTYDAANCSVYAGACDFDLGDWVLSGQHTCGDTLTIRYQQPIQSNDLQQICQTLAVQEQEFHQLFGTTANTPVPHDYNTSLEMVIFSSSADYQNYAGTLFNIGTDNGGMYLEGDPSNPDNQARFIAYQATWLQPAFVVWNLEHEYVHYLDGRFNIWGAFWQNPVDLVWWTEGLAEYLSQGDDNSGALAMAPQKTFQLSELFQTTYNNGTTPRIYQWGYLATRFMFERQRGLIDQTLLPVLRAPDNNVPDAPCAFPWGWRSKELASSNDWFWLYDDSEHGSGLYVRTCGQLNSDIVPRPELPSYQEIMAEWGTDFDTEFHQWLDCIVVSDDCASSDSDIPLLSNGQTLAIQGAVGSEQLYRLELPVNAFDLRIRSQGGSGDVDLYLRANDIPTLSQWDYRPYYAGNNESIDIMAPASTYFLMLHGYQAYQGATLSVSWQEGQSTELETWGPLSSNYARYFWVYVPEQAQSLVLTSNGGTGDARVYIKQQGWPSTTSYNAVSSGAGTSQQLQLQTVEGGNYYHIMVDTQHGFQGLTLKVTMIE